MQLTNAEKLIIGMLAAVHEKLGITDYDPKFLQAAIFDNATWAIDWKMPGISGDDADPTPPEVNEVAKIMTMWEALEESYDALPPADKAELESAAAPFGRNVRFEGFDGNGETELLGIASFFVNQLGRFQHFEGRGFNSHIPSLEAYRRMHAVFRTFATETRHTLSAQNLAEVLLAQRHPSME